MFAMRSNTELAALAKLYRLIHNGHYDVIQHAYLQGPDLRPPGGTPRPHTGGAHDRAFHRGNSH